MCRCRKIAAHRIGAIKGLPHDPYREPMARIVDISSRQGRVEARSVGKHQCSRLTKVRAVGYRAELYRYPKFDFAPMGAKRNERLAFHLDVVS